MPPNMSCGHGMNLKKMDTGSIIGGDTWHMFFLFFFWLMVRGISKVFVIKKGPEEDK